MLLGRKYQRILQGTLVSLFYLLKYFLSLVIQKLKFYNRSKETKNKMKMIKFGNINSKSPKRKLFKPSLSKSILTGKSILKLKSPKSPKSPSKSFKLRDFIVLNMTKKALKNGKRHIIRPSMSLPRVNFSK